MKMLIFILASTTNLYSTLVFGAIGDGVIFDENGLTIIAGKAPVVDSNRWNSSEGVYTLSNGSPGYVKAIKDAQGKVVAVRKMFPNISELHANNVFSENLVTVTTDFCDKFDSQKLDLDAKRCQSFLSDLFKIYESQANDATLKTLQDVAKLDGVAPIASMEALKMSLKNQSYNMKVLENRSIVANIGYLVQKCNALKRYSTEEAEVNSAPTGTKSSSTEK